MFKNLNDTLFVQSNNMSSTLLKKLKKKYWENFIYFDVSFSNF